MLRVRPPDQRSLEERRGGVRVEASTNAVRQTALPRRMGPKNALFLCPPFLIFFWRNWKGGEGEALHDGTVK